MKRLLTILIVTILWLPFTTAAESPEKKGLAIAVEADKRDFGFENYTVNLKMVLKNRHGDESKRIIRSKTLEVQNDGEKTLIIFDTPRDVKGTAFLNVTHKTGDDDQWLFLPALKRVKRISSSNKSGSFMGSEYAYEDIASQEVEKYRYKWLRDEPCPGEEFKGLTCFVSERYPVDKKSGYTRQIEWRDQKEYRQIKVDFYDRKSSLLKTLAYSGYKQYLDQYWRPEMMYMVNQQNGKDTLLVWNDYKFRVGLKDKDFSKNSLKRAR